MKTFWKITGFVFLGLFLLMIIAVVGGLLFLQSFDIKNYRSQIIKVASENLGRTVDFKDIKLDVSLDKGIRLNLNDLTIAESTEFGTGNFVTIKGVDAGVDLLSFVLSRQVSIPGIVINSPKIEIIRNEKGDLNISTFGKAAGPANPGATGAVAALPSIFINSLKIENADLTIIDKTVNPELKLAVTQVNLDIQRFSLSNPFDILLEAALLSPQKNFRLEGKAQLNLSEQKVKIPELGITLELGKLPLETLRLVPLLAGLPFPQLMDGQLNVRLKEAEISDKGLGKLLVDFGISGGKIIALDIAPGISLEAKHIDLSVEDLSLDGVIPAKVSLKAALYQDEVNLDLGGKLVLDLKTNKVLVTDGHFATDLSLWPVKKIKAQILALKDVPLPENLSGKIQTIFKELALSSQGLDSILMDAKLESGGFDLSALVPGIPVELTKTDVTITNFAFGKQFSVIFKTAYGSEIQNLSFDGILSFDAKTQALQIKNGIAGIELNNFPLEGFKESSLIPAGTPFPKTLGGRLQMQIHDLALSPKGLGMIDMNVKWQSGKIEIDDVAPGISVAAQQISLELQNFSLSEPFSVKASLGYESDVPNIFADGQVSFDLAAHKIGLKDLKAKVDLGKLSFERIKTRVGPLKDVKLPEVLNGELTVAVKELFAGPQGLGTVLVDLGFENGEVAMSQAAPGMSVNASQINAVVKNFSLGSASAPFSFIVSLAYLSKEPNIKFDGKVGLDLTEQSATLENSQLTVDLAKISFDRLKTNIAAFKDVSLPESLKGELNVSIVQAAAGPAGLKSLLSEVTLRDWEVKLRELNVPLSGAETKFKITESRLSADNLRFNLGKGRISAKVNVEDYQKTQAFDFMAEINDLNLGDILVQDKAAVKVEGVVFANLNVKGQGADLNSIAGDGHLEIKDAKLKDLNVLKTVLSQLAFVPDFSERVLAKLPEKYAAKLEEPDTRFSKIACPIVVSAGTIVLDPFAIEADEFIFGGKGQATFDQSYSVDGSFQITAELSKIMGDSSEELQYLYDSNSLLTLPVIVTGKGAATPQFSVKEIVRELGKNALRQQAKKELMRVINKSIGTEVQTQPPEGEQGAPVQESQDPASEVIGGILDSIFK